MKWQLKIVIEIRVYHKKISKSFLGLKPCGNFIFLPPNTNYSLNKRLKIHKIQILILMHLFSIDIEDILPEPILFRCIIYKPMHKFFRNLISNLLQATVAVTLFPDKRRDFVQRNDFTSCL